MAIKECCKEHGFPVETACELLHVARSAYYKWASGKLSHRTAENEKLADKIEKIHLENPDKGYGSAGDPGDAGRRAAGADLTRRRRGEPVSGNSVADEKIVGKETPLAGWPGAWRESYSDW